MDKLITTKIEAGLAKLEAMIAELGPEMVDLGLAVARIDAAEQLIYGAVSLLIFIGVFKVWPWSSQCVEKIDDDEGRIVAHVARYAAAGGTLLASSIFLLNSWATPWPWIGVFKPEVWIVYKLLLV